MWTKRERVIWKALGKLWREWGEEGWGRGLIETAITKAVRAACEVNEPDYKAMWEELKRVEEKAAQDENASIRFYSSLLRKDLEYLERRHGGKA